ncbi:MAG: V-type H(+)-translocating pyrophosphatase, K(+)-stimulated pyrophosphate-energized sodium pump [Candidatus Peregrinibacteria bacterium GW2011_GWC2_39_14]|nr:MAG: V-type H(+)-translocating pyrophosphatase, K(+)-stimulated pyrophosphate-energized sodium pump [Candidatus Peregrinibacteria bacterium GW2011_GWC2_39_14]
METLSIPLLGMITAGVAILYAIILTVWVMVHPKGNDTMKRIAKSIQEGASAYLNRQSLTMAVFAIIIFLIINFAIQPGKYNVGFLMGIGFLVGALFSGLAGYIGMNVSVRANVRTAEAARSGLHAALNMAFRGGTITGMFVVGLALLGVSGGYFILTDLMNIPAGPAANILIGFGFGASLISLFARVGGGIYTKAADVGADLVGKIEKNIPEDDPRNPAVIADNVGDNVGDCAGMGADLFETYAVTLIAAMILAASTLTNTLGTNGIEYPILLGVVAVIASIIGSLFVRLGKKKDIMGAMYKGMIVTGLISVVGFYFTTKYLIGDIWIFFASLVGLGVTLFITIITDYYTSKKYGPVKSIAEASKTGTGTNLIAGLAVGMKSTLMPVILICAAIYLAYFFGERSPAVGSGIYGIAIAAVAMLSTTGLVIATDSYGPITDNAGGIAEMAKMPPAIRNITNALDAVGNTTKAVTKGYAISSAALAALVLFQAYKEELARYTTDFTFDISDYKVLIGLFLGGLLPFVFSALCMKSVGKAAYAIVKEVRTQFKQIKGIMTGKATPLYGRCVDIVTKAALKEMLLPALIAILSPIVVGFLLGPKALGGFLIGLIVVGLLLALFMCTGGAAWDNAKKLIEDGKFGGKGSETHKAAVVGDTVGDPFKDTAGPALNSLIKVINTIALIIVQAIVTIKIFG